MRSDVVRFPLMKVLVTGASGHVGANLVRALISQGESVRALVHLDTRAINGLNVEIAQGDIREPESLGRALEDVDTVYHLAASISLTATKQIRAVNVDGTKNVVEACIHNKIQRLVHFSSIHAMAHQPTGKAIDESCLLDESADCPDYNRSKADSEKEVRRGIARGLNAVIIRPTAILGPFDYQPSFFGEVLLSVARGKLPALVAGGFDWVDVRDVVDGAIRAAQIAPPGSDYMLSGHWATIRELTAMVHEATDCGIPRLDCPLWLAGIGAQFATAFDRMRKRRPLFTSFSIKTLQTVDRVSHDKATRELGYHPRPLQRSVEDTLKWFRESGWLNCDVASVTESQE
jgi:dihydroflavonol-4-reductase